MAPAHNPPYIAAMKAFRAGAAGRAAGRGDGAVPVPVHGRGLDDLRGALRVADRARHPALWVSRRQPPLGQRTSQALLGRKNLRHISCHLGGSSSVAAFRNGVAIDVSMGASPQSGLPQNNRVGDIDVFAVLHMMKKLGLGPDEMANAAGQPVGTGGDQRHERRFARSGRGCGARAARGRGWRWMCLCAPSGIMWARFCWSWAAWT